jgi:hypothetical protein
MNVPELERKLIGAARQNPPSQRVPFAFEKRVLAQIRSVPGPDGWALWGHALWRAAASCLAVVLLLGTWSMLTTNANAPAAGTTNSTENFSQAFENTILAAANQEQLADSTW